MSRPVLPPLPLPSPPAALGASSKGLMTLCVSNREVGVKDVPTMPPYNNNIYNNNLPSSSNPYQYPLPRTQVGVCMCMCMCMCICVWVQACARECGAVTMLLDERPC
jgi:hypothetical protein